MDVRDDNDIDYILQVISNGTRRRILKLLADEAPLTYTKIMQKLNIKDSGTLGFHLKKMARLLRRDEFGEYKLSSLGWRALDIMKRLEGIEISEYEEASEEERKSRVFSDQLRFEYTRSLAEKLRGEGVKAIITDIITLIIHPMDRKLFDETVESISDVLTCYVPEDLYDDVVMKSSDVFRIKKYRAKTKDDGDSYKALVKDEAAISGWVDMLVSGLITSITSALTGLASIFTENKTFKDWKKSKGDISFSRNLEFDFKSIQLRLSGGYFNVRRGGGKIIARSLNGDKPDVSYNIVNNTLNIIGSNGYVEIELPNRIYDSISIDVRGGVLKIDDINASIVSMDMNGGVVGLDIDLSTNGSLKLNMTGGIMKTTLDAHEGFKTVEFYVYGGYLDMKIYTSKEPIDIDIDKENGYIDIQVFGERVDMKHRVDSIHKIRGSVTGGYGRIVVNEA